MRVGLKLGRPPAGDLARALEDFGAAADHAEIVVAEAEAVSDEEARELVAFVVAGGGLLVTGRVGPLLAQLNLTPGEELPGGTAEPGAPGLPALETGPLPRVTGVGYVLYRMGIKCAAVGGPRGDGWVAYAGEPLLPACLLWLRERLGEARS